ncbi:thioredoxin [Kaistella flava (ex Peng et al. 2021)]|uniref:Thioredoxin n=1 Tax=Kaistella flava (ex Peng et al. 2021) TaxID=2038776 RepID=A0A7M2Y6U3_9FLAO|nr:thioredoxin [Kaistella flava (ex Peng et al. 2021)]QOW09968.1 thioredoxin [Kaistella flava (ex Peng et al. 2021)]
MKNLTKIIFTASTLFLALQSCESQKVVVNREVNHTKDGKMLLGHQTKDQLLKEPYSEWFVKEHDEYSIDQKAIAELKKEKLNSYNITLVMGTWCEDSHREVPRLFKILEAVGYPETKLTMIAVNRQKEAPNGEEGPLNIQRVPTIIVQKYGKEIGRIIESPSTGYLERDLVDILKKDNTSLKDLIK